MVLWKHSKAARIFLNYLKYGGDIETTYTQIELLNSTLHTAQQHQQQYTKRHETFVFCKFLQVLKFTLYLSRASHYLRITFYICINIFCAWYKKSLCFFSLSNAPLNRRCHHIDKHPWYSKHSIFCFAQHSSELK